jgi:hypothetical protein
MFPGMDENIEGGHHVSALIEFLLARGDQIAENAAALVQGSTWRPGESCDDRGSRDKRVARKTRVMDRALALTVGATLHA